MDVLKQFYEHEAMRDAVLEYLIGSLKNLAVERTFRGEGTSGIPDAKEAIEDAFIALRQTYEKERTPNTDNPAR